MNPYSKLTEYMRAQGKEVAGHDMVRAVVTNVSPIAVRIGEVEIGVNIYCNPVLLLGLNPASISTDETGLKQCLTAFYSAFKLEVGDTVLVQQVKDESGKNDLFFIVCKAVEV